MHSTACGVGGATRRHGESAATLPLSPWVPVPPVGYGGTEVVVDNLARVLTTRGHDVRLFTVGESRCPVRRSWLYARSPSPMGTSIEEAAHVLAAYDTLEDVDVIHDHTVLGPLVGAPRLAISAPPPASTTREPEPAPEPIVIIEPSVSAPEPIRPPPRKAPPIASTAPAPAPRNCDPPFFVDPATGTRRVKPGC